MKEQIETSFPAETLYLWTVTKPAKRLLGIAAERCMPCEKRATAQTAHLVFADPQAKRKKPKELFYANARLK